MINLNGHFRVRINPNSKRYLRYFIHDKRNGALHGAQLVSKIDVET